jgi:hypothetical protein
MNKVNKFTALGDSFDEENTNGTRSNANTRARGIPAQNDLVQNIRAGLLVLGRTKKALIQEQVEEVEEKKMVLAQGWCASDVHALKGCLRDGADMQIYYMDSEKGITCDKQLTKKQLVEKQLAKKQRAKEQLIRHQLMKTQLEEQQTNNQQVEQQTKKQRAKEQQAKHQLIKAQHIKEQQARKQRAKEQRVENQLMKAQHMEEQYVEEQHMEEQKSVSHMIPFVEHRIQTVFQSVQLLMEHTQELSKVRKNQENICKKSFELLDELNKLKCIHVPTFGGDQLQYDKVHVFKIKVKVHEIAQFTWNTHKKELCTAMQTNLCYLTRKLDSIDRQTQQYLGELLLQVAGFASLEELEALPVCLLLTHIDNTAQNMTVDLWNIVVSYWIIKNT